MMGVDHVGPEPREHRGQARRKGVSRMSSEPVRGPQRADAQSAGLYFEPCGLAKRDQLTVDLPRERPRQLEWVSFATAKESGASEWRRSHVNDAHVTRGPR